MIVIAVLALLIFGPRKLPELGRSVGKALSEFRRASADIRMTLEEEVREMERHTAGAIRQVEETVEREAPPAAEAAASPAPEEVPVEENSANAERKPA
jgi:TatA/E family protein of Tat protein translocase